MRTHIHTHTFCTDTWDGMGKLRCGAVPCPNEHDAWCSNSTTSLVFGERVGVHVGVVVLAPIVCL